MNVSFKNYLATFDGQHTIKGASFNDLVALWNEYAVKQKPDSYIWDSIEDYATETGVSGVELAQKVYFGNIEIWGGRVTLNESKNLETVWTLEDSPIDLGELADWLEETSHSTFLAWKENHKTEE